MRFEHWCRGVLVGAGVLASLLVPGTALAGPRAKAQYDGRDATNRQALMGVNKKGTRVAFTFGTRAACTNGKRRALVFIDTDRRRLARVLPDGSFTKSLRDRLGSATVHGTFDAVGNTVTGTYSIVTRSGRSTCRTGDVAFTLHRDGTAGAPYRNTVVATGLYQAAGPGVVLGMRTVLPSRIIHGARVEYHTKCSSGKRRAWSVAPLVLMHGSRFGAVVRHRQRLEAGAKATTRVRIAGAFTYDKGYKVAGTLSARNVINQPGQRPVVCRATIPFTGRFIRGPLGEEGPHPSS
jgi:hypothetical protein